MPHPSDPNDAGRVLLIVNPAAGQEDPVLLRRLLGAAFAVRRIPFDLVETAGPRAAERQARRGAAHGYRAVVAVGGDGTVAEVITGLSAQSAVSLGIIPRGTGNQVAGNIGLPLDIEGAVDVIATGAPVAMDIGRLGDGRHFALIAGAGWDAEVMAVATRALKDRWGFGAYLYAGLKKALAPPSARFRILADGEEFEIRAATVLIANIGQLVHERFAIDLRISPGGSFQDGLLDVCIFTPRNLPDVAAVLWKIARRRYADDERMIYLQVREIHIEAEPPVVTQADGDPAGETPLSARVVPGLVQVLAATRPRDR
jgi:diacylglycerol kinase (ATP)